MRLPIIISPVIFAVLPTPMFAQFGKNSGNTEFAKGDFFIVSSIDLAKKQLLLKRPTEVTELMRVDGETRCFEERGKHHTIGGHSCRGQCLYYVAVQRRAAGRCHDSERSDDPGCASRTLLEEHEIGCTRLNPVPDDLVLKRSCRVSN